MLLYFEFRGLQPFRERINGLFKIFFRKSNGKEFSLRTAGNMVYYVDKRKEMRPCSRIFPWNIPPSPPESA